jgi:D-aspartate ligase
MAIERPPVALLGGLENALSVARSLTRRGIAVHAAGDPAGPVRYSRHRKTFRPVTGDLHAGWHDWLSEGHLAGALVLPCSDDALEFVAHQRVGMVARGLVPIESDDGAVLAMLDKDRTYDVARAAGIAAPRTVRLHDRDDLERAIDEIGVPCALKPVHIHEFARHFRRKAIVARDADVLRAAFATTDRLGLAMILTEIIPGPEDRYCSYFTFVTPDGGFLFDFTKRKLRQYPPGFGGGTYHLTEWADDVAEAGRRFLQAAGVRGLGNVEFKRDPRDGQLKLIECNARFTAANELVRRAGVDIAWIVYSRMTGRPVGEVGRARDGVRMWYPIQDTMAFLETRRAGELTLGAWVRSLAHRQTFPLWAATDPLPSLIEISSVPRRILGKLRARRNPSRSSSPEAALR